MLGDLILWIKEVWKQQTRIHDYNFFHGRSFESRYDHYECQKCGKWKWL